MYLIFDTETTGFPAYFGAPHTDLNAWESARLVQLAWQIHDEWGDLIEVKNFIVRPDGFSIPYKSEQIHGISTERAMSHGVELKMVLEEFDKSLAQCQFVIGHNVEFDLGVMGSEYLRAQHPTSLLEKKSIDTKLETTDYCQIPGGRGGQWKWPTLTELYTKLFGSAFDEAHNASADVEATTRAFLECVRLGVISENRLGASPGYWQEFKQKNPEQFQLIGLNIQPYSPIEQEEQKEVIPQTEEAPAPAPPEPVSPLPNVDIEQAVFAHLHVTTQYSVLQSTIRTDNLVSKAKEMGMPAVAMCDRGNMYGAYNFVSKARANDMVPIVGCELNVCKDMHNKEHKDNGYGVVLLAKNKQGYKNLCKLSSKAHTEGFYYIPRVDRALISQFKEDLIVLSGGIFGEVAQTLMNRGEKEAEELVLSWKAEFGSDFYLEICRQGLEEQEYVNKHLIDWSSRHGIQLVATNNVHYLVKEDAQAHDILLCVKDGKTKFKRSETGSITETPKVFLGKGNRESRFGFPNEDFYFKSTEEMKKLFADVPQAISSIEGILQKIEPFDLKQDVLLPKFDIPEQFKDAQDETDDGKRGENNYLRHLTYEGARKRWGEISPEVRERLDFELMTIENSGYPGYFLIVQDFTSEARKMGVSVGPGRGSAAGSAVAYCIGITNVDPIKYDLLFERFLNPERISLPDIDIDFDDRGRDKIIDWVVNKYGSSQVAQIITYGTMAAKSSVRDTARVLDLPLPDADRIAKLIPDLSLHKLLNLEEKELKAKVGDRWSDAEEFRKLAKEKSPIGETIRQAAMLEGSLRNTGTHACGVIITPTDITDHVPVASQKDSELVVTQFDNAVVEDAGLLKMDFLGLKTLTLINDAIDLIEEGHGIKIDPDEIPLDDLKTYELFQRGETNGIFQYESPGMQKHMKHLKPDSFGDLIAMNALYRPGPIAYIPEFIERKHGNKEISYDLPEMEEYLKETYGITVYQEQVMLLSQKLGGFSKGQADALRKGMGKKKKEVIDAMWPLFLEGCQKNGHPEEVVNKIWKDWEAFASYAFNKSHSTCYALIAFQTAYLKANYPAEYMASVLSNNMDNIKSVTFFMEECRRMGIPVLGPCVNESAYRFRVNDKGEIRFGLGAIKGVGENAVECLVTERKENGPFVDCFDLVKRVDLRTANKKSFESMILGGGWDSFGAYRSQYLTPIDEKTFLDTLVRFGQAFQQGKNGPATLFGDSDAIELRQPELPAIPPWTNMETLRQEKQVIGIYLSAHPLDEFKLEMDHFSRGHLGYLEDLKKVANKEMSFGAIVTGVQHRMTKNNKPFGILELEDYKGSKEFFLFGEDYLKFRHFFVNGTFLFVKGRVMPRWKGNDQLEFKIQSLELLSDVRAKLAKSITIKMELDNLDEKTLEQLSKLLTENQGQKNCSVKFEVIDKKAETLVELPSRTMKVELTNELIGSLEEMQEVKYKLN